jgi:hypothetical protein
LNRKFAKCGKNGSRTSPSTVPMKIFIGGLDKESFVAIAGDDSSSEPQVVQNVAPGELGCFAGHSLALKLRPQLSQNRPSPEVACPQDLQIVNSRHLHLEGNGGFATCGHQG